MSHHDSTGVGRSPVPLLTLQGVSKLYANGTLANDDVSLSIHAGEIHAIVGENGAGKSTLMKLLYGLEQPSSGTIVLDGKGISLRHPAAAIAQGIGLVPQHLKLVPSFTVAQNIVLGQEPMKRMLVDRRAAVERVQELSRRFGLDVDPHARVGDLPIGVQQRVEVLKTLYRGARILMLDEPSAVLSAPDAQALFGSLRQMVDSGLTVVLITHKVNEVLRVADRFTVLRGGKVSGDAMSRDVDEATVARMMIGRELAPSSLRRAVTDVAVDAADAAKREARSSGGSMSASVSVRELSAMRADGSVCLQSISFDIGAGEILGIAGVEGNGQDVLADILCGLRMPSQGEGRIDGRLFTGSGVRAARARGLAIVPEDRLHNGVAPDMSIADNVMAIAYRQPPLSRRGWLDVSAAKRMADRLIAACQVVAQSADQAIGALSGGNMQKVMLGREIATRPRFLVACQPTRGVDIGAARALREQLAQLRDGGAAILLISADLDEVLALSDRIAVMAQGRLVGHFCAVDTNADQLAPFMTGTRRQADATALRTASYTCVGKEDRHAQ